jgi:hypothetical protein
MLTYADVAGALMFYWLVFHLLANLPTGALGERMLTYAHVCSLMLLFHLLANLPTEDEVLLGVHMRMLTYADGC